MQKWEYSWRRIYCKGGFLGGGHYELTMKDRTLKDQQIWAHLDKLGRNGWELVSTIPEIVGQGGPVEIGNIEISPKTKNLVVSGPYKYTRNPMLFGTFLMYLAFALFINSITAVVFVSAIFVFMLTVVVKMEEKRLLKDFGKQYEEYRKKVSMFIPWFQRKIE